MVSGNGTSTRGCSVVTVGTYDGVHLGHRRLIDETMRSARDLGCRGVVVTFAVHPSKVLRPDAPVPLLCTLDKKLELLKATGIDEVVVLEFDVARARESAEDFVVRDLVERLAVKEVVVGSNFRFGHKRQGDVALLERLGGQYGFVTKGVELVLDDEHHSVVSSTRIRSLIASGALREAERLLGRPYLLSGTMDANLEFRVATDLLVPPAGRYQAVITQEGAGGSTGPVTLVARAVIREGRTFGFEGLDRSHRFDPQREVTVALESDREQPVEGDR